MNYLKSEKWDVSYAKKDNFVFYPHEEVIRFVSKYISKKVDFNGSFKKNHQLDYNPKILDLGCGIGRHVKFVCEYNLDGYGIDFSSEAIKIAKGFLAINNISELDKRLIVGETSALPFHDNFFDFAISHGVLDSMPFEIAKKSIKELSRCLTPSGLAYIDVISGDDNAHYPQYSLEELVETDHEKGTIQSFFNWSKIENMVENFFLIKEASLIKNISQTTSTIKSRYHIVLENKKGQSRMS